MCAQQSSDLKSLQLSLNQKISILLSFAKDKVVEQIQCVWFIILYLIVFQVLVLGLHRLFIDDCCWYHYSNYRFGLFYGGSEASVIPLGETLGSTLPRKKILGLPCLPVSLAFGFVLGAFATFAEPAMEFYDC